MSFVGIRARPSRGSAPVKLWRSSRGMVKAQKTNWWWPGGEPKAPRIPIRAASGGQRRGGNRIDRVSRPPPSGPVRCGTDLEDRCCAPKRIDTAGAARVVHHSGRRVVRPFAQGASIWIIELVVVRDLLRRPGMQRTHAICCSTSSSRRRARAAGRHHGGSSPAPAGGLQRRADRESIGIRKNGTKGESYIKYRYWANPGADCVVQKQWAR